MMINDGSKRLAAVVVGVSVISYDAAGADPEFGKRGGTLLKKVEEKQKGHDNTNSYLPNILYHVCYVKSYL